MFDELTNNLKISLDGYFLNLKNNPFEILTVVLDFLCVAILIYMFFTLVKKSRAWQLLKGIVFLIVITTISGWLKLRILNFILTSIMTYGVIALLIIFQPELRRTLEQLGSNTKFLSKFFEFNTSVRDKVKDDIYKVTVAVNELAKSKTGALIVFERDIKLTDIIETGLEINSEISPQLLVNIFVPNTPLHDGAVIISNNKITAAACILPLSDDKNIARELGTRHRAGIGISKDSDAIVVIVSEETGSISIANNGVLIRDVKDEALKRILIKNLVTERFGTEERRQKFVAWKEKIKNKNDKNVK